MKNPKMLPCHFFLAVAILVLAGCMDASPWPVQWENEAASAEFIGTFGCSDPESEKSANVAVYNESGHGIDVFLLDEDCNESLYDSRDPAEISWVTSWVTSVFRVRDADDGAFIIEFTNSFPDSEVRIPCIPIDTQTNEVDRYFSCGVSIGWLACEGVEAFGDDWSQWLSLSPSCPYVVEPIGAVEDSGS